MHTAYDLLHHYPTAYIDRSTTHTVREIRDNRGEYPQLQLRGRFVSFNVLGEGASMRLIGLFTDGTATLDCVWFKGIRELRRRIAAGTEYVIFGKPTWFRDTLQITHPEVDPPEAAEHAPGVRAVYPLTEKLRQRNISSRTIHSVIVGFLKSRNTP